MNRDEILKAVKDAGAVGITAPAIVEGMNNVQTYERYNEIQKVFKKLRAMEKYGIVTGTKTAPGQPIIWRAEAWA